MMVLRSKFIGGYPQVFSYPKFILVKGHNTINNPEIHFLEQAAVYGITNARALAKLFALVLQGEIISKELVERFYNPLIIGTDAVINFPFAKGYGFMYEPHPKKPGKWLFGHPGNGGSNLMVDPEEEIVIAYVTNGMKSGMGEMCRTYRLLRNATFDSLHKFPKENVPESLTDAIAPMLD
uniref:Beta-lactamase-related domain-containing protein n=1 Tax=Acrobeloides nanus TaxID=290746 RepID=A0A914EMI5_9BILA